MKLSVRQLKIIQYHQAFAGHGKGTPASCEKCRSVLLPSTEAFHCLVCGTTHPYTPEFVGSIPND